MSTDRGHHPQSTTELLRLAGDGHQAAWEEIVRRYRDLVAAKVRVFKMQDADVHDAIQMTWLRLMENCHRIQFPELLGPWLATTATNECLAILRAAARSAARSGEMIDTAADPASGPEQRVIGSDTARMLHDLVAELAPHERTLIRSLFSERPPSYAELAGEIRIPLGSLGPTRARALRKLRRKLNALHFRAA